MARVAPLSPLQSQRPDGPVEVPGANGYDDGFDPEDYRRRDVVYFQADEDDFDPLTLVASETSMTEQLLADLLVSISVEDHRIAEYLVGSLDEQGFLPVSLQSIANELNEPLARVENVLRVLQRSG